MLTRREVERILRKRIMSFVDLPPRDSMNGKAKYMETYRKIQKLSEDPVFVKAFRESQKPFLDFVRSYDFTVEDIRWLLNRDLKL